MVASALLRNSVSIEEWLAATTFVKYCTLKKLFPAINYKEKMFFRNNYSTLDHSLFLWVFTYYFTKIFVHLSVIAAVCYFSIYKLIVRDPANVYFFKVNSRTLEKGVNFFELLFGCPPWLTLGQLLAQCESLHFDYFDLKVTRNLVTR